MAKSRGNLMPISCFFRWPHRENVNEIEWLFKGGVLEPTIQQGTLEELAALLTADMIVTACFPGMFCGITLVELPQGRKQKVNAALPYLLEDQIISDVDALHFTSS